MIDYQAIQLTGSKCQGRNCAAASDADAIYFGTGGKVKLTADDVRAQSGKDCIPGSDTPSGGLFISDVIRVAALHGVTIDYGSDSVTFYTRWTPSQAESKLSHHQGGIFLGDYDQVPAPYRQPGSTFTGDHSAWGHDYREDLPAFGGTKPEPTVCWHDPLRKTSIRLPFRILAAYWQKPSNPIHGFAGFVVIPAAPQPVTGENPMVPMQLGHVVLTTEEHVFSGPALRYQLPSTLPAGKKLRKIGGVPGWQFVEITYGIPPIPQLAWVRSDHVKSDPQPLELVDG